MKIREWVEALVLISTGKTLRCEYTWKKIGETPVKVCFEV
jgi:hypothetical protein